MSGMIDETGNQYGRLTVLGLAGVRNNRAFWHCKCSCEAQTECDIMGKYLRSGETKSCGCLKREAYKYAVQANIKRNKIIEDSVYIHVFFNNSKEIMICDKKSWTKAKDITWHVTEGNRVRGCVDGKMVLFHDFILDFTPTEKLMVDHKNRNPLDNRLENLRIVERVINANNLTDNRKNNTSGCVGVYKANNKWSAQIRNERLGTFDTKEEAIKARKDAELKYLKNIKYEYMDDVNEDIYADYEYIEEIDACRKISTGEIIQCYTPDFHKKEVS